MANGTTNVGFEDKLWLAADKLRGSMDASEYKHVVLGLIFLKFVSDSFNSKYDELVHEAAGFEEDKDEYTADNIFYVGRLWHTLILSKWKEFFLWLPVETLIKERQENYYLTINAANTDGESSIFVQFMLGVLRDALKELVNASSDSSQLEVKETNEEKVLLLSKNGKLTAKGLATEIGISQRQVERIVNNLKVSGKIQRIGANKGGCWEVYDMTMSE